MAGLTDQASGAVSAPEARLAEARRRWEASMLSEIERMRHELRQRDPLSVAELVDAGRTDHGIAVAYWGRTISIDWPDLQPREADGRPLAAFDSGVLIHHLRVSDGSTVEGRWVGFRELPGGGFYHQAYLGYTGDRLAKAFGPEPNAFERAARALNGSPLDGPSPFAWRFSPLPRLPLAACLWPGDEDFPAQAAVLFDASAARHMPIDGLALLGAGLTGRLLNAAPQN